MRTLLACLCALLCLSPTPVFSAVMVAAATNWAAAFARAAGAEHVVVIAPENLQHPPDYDPKPTDLLRLKDARFILLGGFEGFAARLRDAAGSDAQMVEVRLINDPENIHAEVRRLAELFGSQDRAEVFLREFDAEYGRLHLELRQYFSGRGNRAVAHKFMGEWAKFAGLELLGTYGPGQVQPSDVLRLSKLQPNLVLDNAHMPSGAPIAEAAGAGRCLLLNFPAPGMDLLGVFRANAATLLAAGR